MSTINPIDRSFWQRSFFLIGGSGLSLYGGLGLLFDLHLFQRIAQALDLWRQFRAVGQWPGFDAPYVWNPPAWFLSMFEPLSSHFDRAVLWVWLAWGLGILLLLRAAGRQLGFPRLAQRQLSWRDGLALAFLLGIGVVAYLLRARFLLPLPNGSVPISHYDEMVYLEASLLWQKGLHPYVDFFLAHPPGILYVFWPATLLWGASWGGLPVLVTGRWIQLVLSLLAVGLVYLIGREMGGRRGGLLAALILALDVEVLQVAPLETVVNLAALLALGLYLLALKTAGRAARFFLLFSAGGFAAFAVLAKVPGAAALLLLGLLAVLAGGWSDLFSGALGAAATALLLGGRLALRSPLSFFRQVVAFQMLRPQETAYGRNHLARMAEYPGSRLTFLLLIVAVLLLTAGALIEAWRLAVQRRGRRPGADEAESSRSRTVLRPVRLRPAGAAGWAFPLALTVPPLLFLFSYGRAYHSRYYVQLVPLLALLVAAAMGSFFALAQRAHRWPGLRYGLALAGALGLVLLLGPHLVHQRIFSEMVRYDGTYIPIGEALRTAVPKESAVLALDPGYVLLAERPPVRFPDNTYLADGAGLMVYRALGIGGMSPAEVWRASRQVSREIDPKAVFHLPAAQDLVVTALRGAKAVVIDPRIAAEDLTPQTQEFLASRGQQVLWQQYTAAFTVERLQSLGRNQAGLALWDLNLRSLSVEGEGPAAPPGEPLQVAPGVVVQASLYWYVESPPAGTLKVSFELRDVAGTVVARLGELPHFGEPATEHWRVGWVYQDHHNLPLPIDLAGGDYTLYANLLSAASGQPWSWVGAEVSEWGLPVGVVRVQP